MTDKEKNFNFIDKNEMTLEQERVAWRNKHPKPWYLRPQLTNGKRNKQQTN